MSNVITLAPEEFQRAALQLHQMVWRKELTVDEIGSPQRIAPHSVAISAEWTRGCELLSSGRLILLHDPRGNEAWQGTFRLASYVSAEVDLAMVADPLLPDVSWSWLTDALENNGCVSSQLSGTVTASYGRSFGSKSGEPDSATVELRSSWTPQLDAKHSLENHLSAWQDLLSLVAGEPPLPQGISAIHLR